jgi:hypothetical protein
MSGILIPLPVVRTAEEWTEFKTVLVFNRKFAYEEIVLDGKNYMGCEFTHVSLFYDGTTPAAMTIADSIRIPFSTSTPTTRQWCN